MKDTDNLIQFFYPLIVPVLFLPALVEDNRSGLSPSELLSLELFLKKVDRFLQQDDHLEKYHSLEIDYPEEKEIEEEGYYTKEHDFPQYGYSLCVQIDLIVSYLPEKSTELPEILTAVMDLARPQPYEQN